MKASPFAIVVAFVAVALMGGQAFAHARLVKAEPTPRAAVTASPTRLWLRFNEVLRLAGSGVELVTPDGRAILLQPLIQDPTDVRAVIAPLPANLPPGRYQVRWRALSPDAHHTRGDFEFVIKP